jgi:hypothetical protein
MSVPTPSSSESIAAARRELHELTILSSAMLRLATRVQSRCDALRHTLGDVAPITDGDVDRLAPRPAVDGVRAAQPGHAHSQDDDDPAALMAMSLAGEGMSRAQIGDYLRQSFGIQETDELLDRVLPDHA